MKGRQGVRSLLQDAATVIDVSTGSRVAGPLVVAADFGGSSHLRFATAPDGTATLTALHIRPAVPTASLVGPTAATLTSGLPNAGTDWDTAKIFSQAVVMSMAADAPQRYVGKMTKSLRGGKIFIDYFRNSREATAIAPYSTRARPGAPVSTPVTWERLSRTTGGNDFSLLDLKKRLKDDAWAEIGKVRQKLPEVRSGRR